jgi:hypothetical protein
LSSDWLDLGLFCASRFFAQQQPRAFYVFSFAFFATWFDRFVIAPQYQIGQRWC